MKSLIIWPKSENISHINYHYAQFGEVVDYLNKKTDNSIIAVDCDVQDVDIIEIIKTNGITKVIMQVNYENARNSFNLAQKLKKQFGNIAILAYGNIPAMLPNLFKNSSFDAMFKDGDFESCIESFLKNFNKNIDLSEQCLKLRGMYLIDKGKFLRTKKGEYIRPNEWGISREGQVPVEEYDKRKGKNRYVINISRGCPFDCSHCLIQLTEGRLERRRSLENLEDAIGEIKDKYKYKHIKFWAANFTLDKQYVKDFCKMMKEKYPDITWECATRIDLVENKEMLKEMYSAGCRQISLGIESLNNDELIHTKDFNKSQIFKAISDIQSAGIQVKGCIMLGMPNQTKESIVNTLKFLVDNHVIIRPTIYTPYQLLGEDVDLSELSKYNRKTLENNSVPGVTAEQLLQLKKSPYNYEEILHLQERREYASAPTEDTFITPRDIAQLTKEKMESNPGYVSRQLQEISKVIDAKIKEEVEK